MLDLGLGKSFFPVELVLLGEVSLESVMGLSDLFGEVVNLWPVIVPQIELNCIHLLGKLCVVLNFKWSKYQLRRALNNWLAFTQQRKHTIMTLVCPKLFSGGYNGEILAVSHKNGALTWRDVYLAVIGVVNVHVGSHVEDKVLWVFAVLYVVLLALNRVYLFHLELALLVLESVVVRVVLLFDSLWFQNVWVARFLLLFWWLGDLLLWNLNWDLLWLIIKPWLTWT